MKPVCIACQRFYRVKKNGHFFIEAMPTEVPACGTQDRHMAVPGKSEVAFWKPYKLWSGDLWECPGCGTQTVSGVGRGPVAEHFQPDFADQLERVRQHQELVQINDC
jgi:hypothetical protein